MYAYKYICTYTSEWPGPGFYFDVGGIIFLVDGMLLKRMCDVDMVPQSCSSHHIQSVLTSTNII